MHFLKKQTILLIALFLSITNYSSAQQIEISDNNYHCYSTNTYYLDSDALIITSHSDHGEGHTDTVFTKTLSKKEQVQFKRLCKSFPIDSLLEKYSSPEEKNCNEGVESRIISAFVIKKHTRICDYYQKDIANIFKIINSFIPADQQDYTVTYTEKEFQIK